MPETISFKLNNRTVSVTTDGDRLLLWVLRTDLGVTGTKYGCGEGHCGCCTVLVDDVAVRSCLVPIKSVKDKAVMTVEGLGSSTVPHPIQRAFIRHDAYQCGFCTPGQMLQAFSLLKRKPLPTREDVIQGMNNNYCRCGAYTRIIEAVLSAADIMKGGK